ncbi:unnamed protein product [Rotaria socialis]|uniref:Cytidyltransferase-like domain-containing protein n=1 Tax=Rotaria socialis TaxID=392032 RepID=A0A818QMH3_9BILA|nr:unnamed protein product [Rotaria socialis]CAF3643467.1 unnamed protein product [Rotaria socialis]CAF4458648.1 unnamed protein product [Rotaria socialis]CAF4507120.1 unnamed protein product [Rotaria socialis]CAF4618491.1 unnamed protein product [Rotaria socialis]
MVDNCVLISTGSFNPVHHSHFSNLLNVQQHLENVQDPPWNVLAGYISPTHDLYVHSKLGDSAWIPADDHCRLCDQVIQNYEGAEVSSWITVARGESEWSAGFVDFPPVRENLRDFLNNTLVTQEKLLKYPLRVVYACSLDHFNRCPEIKRLTESTNMACAVVYRVGEDEEQIFEATRSPNIIYVPLLDQRHTLSNLSSTQIRKYFQNPNSATEPFIYPNVYEYMSRRFQT